MGQVAQNILNDLFLNKTKQNTSLNSIESNK